MPKSKLTFEKAANPAPKAGSVAAWSAPQLTFDVGGNLAVWAEHGAPNSNVRSINFPSQPHPCMVLHGGPGASLNASHVAPLRSAGLPWFGFDQRNSGLSEDLDHSEIDLQRFVDDALEVADRLSLKKFHILGGSWGATLALAIATYRPERVVSVVLRAPFIPLRSRVDAFFEAFECLAPDYFADHFGKGARTKAVCECFEVAEPERVLALSVAWSRLESALLRRQMEGHDKQLEEQFASRASLPSPTFLTDVQELALVRKYRLQAHFLQHDCFFNPADWDQLVVDCARATWPLTIVQGLNDRVCPPGGARQLSEAILRTRLVELPDTGHLPDAAHMIQALSEALRHHQLRT